MKLMYLVLIVLMTVSCSTVTDKNFKASELDASHWQSSDFSTLNELILEASSSNQDWVQEIHLYVYKLFDLSGLKRVVVESVFDSTENPTKATVTLVRDGFLDDSVRGDIHVITFHRTMVGLWEINDLKKSHRCWRSSSDEYRTDPCP